MIWGTPIFGNTHIIVIFPAQVVFLVAYPVPIVLSIWCTKQPGWYPCQVKGDYQFGRRFCWCRGVHGSFVRGKVVPTLTLVESWIMMSSHTHTHSAPLDSLDGFRHQCSLKEEGDEEEDDPTSEVEDGEGGDGQDDEFEDAWNNFVLECLLLLSSLRCFDVFDFEMCISCFVFLDCICISTYFLWPSTTVAIMTPEDPLDGPLVSQSTVVF